MEVTLCTILMVQSYMLCTIDLCCAHIKVQNVVLYQHTVWRCKCSFVLIRWGTWRFVMYVIIYHLDGAQCDVVSLDALNGCITHYALTRKSKRVNLTGVQYTSISLIFSDSNNYLPVSGMEKTTANRSEIIFPQTCSW